MAALIKKTGVVKAVRGHMAVVLTSLEPACESCKAKDACTSLGGGGANAEVKARNTIGAEAGDLVTIAMTSSSLLKATFLVYMLPILALIVGIVLGHLLSELTALDKNVLVASFGLLAFSGTFIWLRKKGDKISSTQEYIPKIISKKTPQKAIPATDLACLVK